MNMAGEVDQLRYAREHGLNMMGETCPQYLFFTEEDLRREDGAKWVCSPPMRSMADNRQLWQGLESSTIQVVSTDHCPFFYDGTTPINYEGRKSLSPARNWEKMTSQRYPTACPAWVTDAGPLDRRRGQRTADTQRIRCIALHQPRQDLWSIPKERVSPAGSDADIAIWDPNKEVRYGCPLPGTAQTITFTKAGSLKASP